MVTVTTGGELLVRQRERPVVSSGFRPLDALLPAGGVRPGSLIEWLAEGDAGPGGGGAASLACAVACRLAAARGDEVGEQARPRTIVVVDRTGWFHPPAVMPWLGDERRLVVARPSRDDDEIWTIDQALRCTGVAAVLAWPRNRVGRSTATRGSRLVGSAPGGALQQWSTAMRRWQLAAASSGAVGLFVRPLVARSEPSWAEARIAVSPLPGASRQSGGTRSSAAAGRLSPRMGSTRPMWYSTSRGDVPGRRPGVLPQRGGWPARRGLQRRRAEGAMSHAALPDDLAAAVAGAAETAREARTPQGAGVRLPP
jgi:hypothetical protein